jgi:transposase
MTITKEQIHVVTSVERRRRWSIEEKRTIIQETYLPGMSLSLVARKYGIYVVFLKKMDKKMLAFRN